MNGLQPMPLFEPKADPTNTSARWTQWIQRFKTYLVASNVKDTARQRALLLYQAGPEVHEIFKTLPETGDDKDFEAAINALTAYFEPEKNRIYQTYTFRQAAQQDNETIDEFHTRLRRLAKYCEFEDVEFEIKMQIVCNGTSSRLRKKALKESNYSLKDMLIDGRKSETCSAQASGMEEKFKDVQLNQVERKPAESTCYNCGFAYPHADRPCPAANSTCNSCGILGHFSRVCRKKESRRFSKPQLAQESLRRREQPKEPYKPETKTSKQRNHARAVNKHRDSSTETSSEDDYVYVVENKPKDDPKTKTNIRVNSVEIKFIVDTGATVDVIDSKTYDRLKSSVKLCKSTTKIFAYGSDKPLPLKGQFQATLESNKRYTVSVIYVVEGGSGNLLSAKTAQDLALIQLVNKVTELETRSKPEVSKPEVFTPERESGNMENTDERQPAPASTPKCADQTIQKIIDKYATVFIGEGKLNTQQVGLHINENIKPVVQPQRRIPYHIRKDVSKELGKLVAEDMIERVCDQPTPWISPIVCTPKKDGGTRICVDMRAANQAIERERHVMPTLSDFRAEMNGSKYFSKIDLKQAYHQLELTEESRYITTFSTHEGLFCYKRLNYGTNSAPEIFQNILQRHLSDIGGVKNIADDIIVHGKTRKQHDEALENCLKRLEQLNLKAKPEKCSFLSKEIKFYGLIFTASGTRPDPARIDNLVKASAPKNASEVRSFLGLANTCREYVPEYAEITRPLRDLTKKSVVFNWNNTHQRAFEQIKKKLTHAPTMAYFDTEKRSLLIVDASPLGICAILAQREKSGESYRIISYASRALSPVESRYSQTDIEGLSLVWGIEHFRLFLLGTEFDVYTDHKALEAIFNNPKSKPPARIERWMLRLQPYNFRVIYKKGTVNEADYLSRHPTTTTQGKITIEEKIADNYVNYIINNAIPKSMTLQEIKEATLSDTILKKVQECMKSGKWDEKDVELKSYHMCAEELTATKAGDLILKGSRIVIPKALQDRATQLGHVGHQGIEKTKALLREKIWYPGMDSKIKTFIENCAACQAVGPGNPPEPMRITPTATEPWQSLALDFYGPIPHSGQYLLVVTDTYSKFPEVEIVKSTSAKACIPKLDRIFATHGIPKKIKSDNGPPFNGNDFKRYMVALGIEWTTSTPLWPQGNGNAESVMKPLGKAIKTSVLEGKNWRQELQRFLLNYRSTPHATTKIPPCELLFNRKVQGSLPELSTKKIVNKHQSAKENIERKKIRNKQYYDAKKNTRTSTIKEGDIVICKQKPTNKLSPRFNPERLTIVKRKGATATARNDSRSITRNVSHFKVVKPADERSSDEEMPNNEDDVQGNRFEDDMQDIIVERRPILRRSTRNQRTINRFGNAIPSGLIS